jgi:hypothetical protein
MGEAFKVLVWPSFELADIDVGSVAECGYKTALRPSMLVQYRINYLFG